MQETWVWSLGREDPLEKEMVTHSGTLAWRIPWREEPGGLQSMGSQRVGHNWATSLTHSNWAKSSDLSKELIALLRPVWCTHQFLGVFWATVEWQLHAGFQGDHVWKVIFTTRVLVYLLFYHLRVVKAHLLILDLFLYCFLKLREKFSIGIFLMIKSGKDIFSSFSESLLRKKKFIFRFVRDNQGKWEQKNYFK